MAANGIMITNSVVVTWDGVSQRIARGTVLDTPNGGALQTAIGGSNWVALTAQQQGGSPGVDPAMYRSNMGTEPYNAGQV